MKRYLRLLLLLVVPACESRGVSSQELGAAQQALSARDEARWPQPTLPGAELIAQLDGREARTLCEQAGNVIDLCALASRRESLPAQCEARLAACRAQTPGPTIDCRDARFDFPEPCTATVDDYLQCVEARSAQMSCTYDEFGLPPPPEECLPLLQKCAYLESEFGPSWRIVPRCDPNSPPRMDEDDDIVGFDVGRPRPARMVTLGDSIAACFPAGFSSCAPTLISEYVREHHAPDLQYQSLAVPGAVTADVMSQASLVTPGPGHLLVWIYVGGNDLLRCAQPNLPAAQTCIDNLLAALPGMWSQIFAYFDDAARFPDGVTFMLNTQYSLYDQCTHQRGPEYGAFADATIQRFNRDIIMQAALARANVVAVDQYPDFLGHAQNANHRGCPHCSRDDNSPWLLDGTHPNERGNLHIADKWEVAIDRAYGTTGGSP